MNSSAGHGVRVCQFGITHSRCRCMSRRVIRITCPTPLECADKAGVKVSEAYQPKHRKDAEDDVGV